MFTARFLKWLRHTALMHREISLEKKQLFVHDSCVATKTISLELDAYEKLRSRKRAGESFSEVVRRAEFTDTPPTGQVLLDYFRKGGSGIDEAYLDAVERAEIKDALPDDPWR